MLLSRSVLSFCKYPDCGKATGGKWHWDWGAGPSGPSETPANVGMNPNPNGTLTSDDPFGGETFASDGTDSPFNDPLSGLLPPGGLGCDLSGCDLRGRLRVHHPPRYMTNPYWLYNLLLGLRFATRSGLEVWGESEVQQMQAAPQELQLAECVANEELPINLKEGSKQAIDKGIRYLLRRTVPKLAEGMDKADPYITLADTVRAVVQCGQQQGK